MNARYANPDDDPRGVWKSGDLTSKTKAKGHSYPIVGPNGVVHYPSPGRQWAPSLESFERWNADGRIWFGKNGTNRPSLKQYLTEVQDGIVPLSIWFRDEVGDNQEAKKEITILNNEDIFDTPKPERLVQRVLTLSTNEHDLVLDSFLGSGTTASVAHKMRRRYIGIEMGEHARTHCLPRLAKVVAGEQGGISKSVNWQGGGGFRFATLGNPIFDELGRIDTSVQFSDLAAFVWQQETGTSSGVNRFTSPCLGEYNGVQYFLLFNGILGDKRPDGGNVLNYDVWDALVRIYPFDGPRVVFGEAVKLPPTIRTRERVMFKKIPYTLRGQGAL
jgi:adenine-specific DNA-methyltransferase